MLKICLLLSIVLTVQVSRACDDDNNDEVEQLAAARQQSDEYFARAFGYNPASWSSLYYPVNSRLPSGYANLYESRTPSRSPISRIDPYKKYSVNNDEDVKINQQQAEGRFALGGLGASIINTGIFNNRFTPANAWRPFSNLANRIPVSYNPNFDNPLDTFDACTSPSGDAGICVPGSVCSLFGGRPSGSCVLGKVCCINTITTCGGTVTLNNTYWQSPTTAVSASSTCALTLRLDTKYVEQLKKPICQIRLDFVSFTTAQPTVGTCTDTFQVSGSTTIVPVICGDNAGQHMYLDVSSSAITSTDVQLMFNFGTSTATRSWNIKIALLPCGASYLAPVGCLQYFSSATGRVRSFNWQDIAGTATRQLNNQNYNICFRTELVSSQRATQMCVSTCQVTSGDAFSITTVPPGGTDIVSPATAASTAAATFAATLSAVGTLFADVAAPGPPAVAAQNKAVCLYDFLLIAGGKDANGVQADRYCGNALNPAPIPFSIAAAGALVPAVTLGAPAPGGSATSVQVCTAITPFRMTFNTDGTEAAITIVNAPTVPVLAAADTANAGFCLDYQEK